ncbi:MAG: hypothetical protein HQ515_10645 [Phycisphaeraceae bacterium]|nr:hypothetical protein [Phycisphaeraceae bacterium]
MKAIKRFAILTIVALLTGCSTTTNNIKRYGSVIGVKGAIANYLLLGYSTETQVSSRESIETLIQYRKIMKLMQLLSLLFHFEFATAGPILGQNEPHRSA